jgi:hypothetical protein
MGEDSTGGLDADRIRRDGMMTAHRPNVGAEPAPARSRPWIILELHNG